MPASSFIACGLPGLSELAARLEQEPDFTVKHLFFSDAITDEEIADPQSEESIRYNLKWEFAGPFKSLKEDEQRAEREHVERVEQEEERYRVVLERVRRHHDLETQKDLLELILPRIASSIETLVYLPYLSDDSDMIAIFLALAPTFTALKRLTLYLLNHRSVVLPTLPTLTHLHLINPETSTHTISSLTSLLPSLTHLRLTSLNQLPSDLICRHHFDPNSKHMLYTGGYVADVRPLATVLPQKVTILLQPAYPPGVIGHCGTRQAGFDSTVVTIQRIAEVYPNVKLLLPVKKDWERRMPVFPLSRALEEGGWTDALEEGVPSTGEWEWDIDGREGEEFWWNQGRLDWDSRKVWPPRRQEVQDSISSSRKSTALCSTQ